eukprot:g6201.t1
MRHVAPFRDEAKEELTILSETAETLERWVKVQMVWCSLESVFTDVSGDPPAESIPFSTKVQAKGNIEEWLGTLLGEMQATLKDIARNAAANIAVAGRVIKALRGFVDNYIAQFALLGIQLPWTTDTQNALDLCKQKKSIMKETNTKMIQVLTELSSWCLQDLGSKMNRRKIETLVTIHVHQRDVTNDLATLYKQKKLHDGNDFEWFKQARFSWRSDQAGGCNPDGAAVISITDVDFCYQWECLGCKERLVITPLTDRCYITLAQACGTCFGGVPAGPAGTGKAETTKDLGRALGLWVAVTNCTDQQPYTDCAKIFKGLCQGGVWGCFDEFNRVQLPVLSVVAQQVLAIIGGKKTGVESFQFPRDPQLIGILLVCSFFITMNPGYAGRQELPKNLKVLFRGVTMVVPNFQIIMEVKLCSVGYTDYSLLALTLANGDRMPMTDNVKAMFEVETLVNASPATVSRAGIIYVSDTDLDWKPVLTSWLKTRSQEQQDIIGPLTESLFGGNTKIDVGHMIDFLNRHTEQVMKPSRVGQINRFTGLLQGLLEGEDSTNFSPDPATIIGRLVMYCTTWSFGGLLEHEGREKFHEFIHGLQPNLMPTVEEGEAAYEYFVNPESGEWQVWRPPQWKYPKTPKLDFSNLLVPTMDSTRAMYLVKHMHKQRRGALMVGGSGTAKTSTAYMFLNTLDPLQMLVKNYNFSSATTPFMFQMTIEGELDKRGGKSFGPPNGKKLTFFLDDLSMPLINDWGDQPTLESTRLVLEQGYFTFLDKDKRGDFKTCEDLQYIAAMQHPTGGRNDIPNRLRSKFFAFNLVLPSITSINDMYGQMLAGRFTSKEFKPDFLAIVSKLTATSITLWRKMQAKMLPTPAKFHYVFNLRDLSRVFQGVLLTPKETYLTGGGIMANEGKVSTLTNKKHSIDKMSCPNVLVNVWKHECERVFCDKLTNNTDKDWYLKYVNEKLL